MKSRHWSLDWNLVLVQYNLLIIDWLCSAQEWCHCTTRAHWSRHCCGTQYGVPLMSTGSVCYSKLVKLYVVRYISPPQLTAGLTESRGKDNGSLAENVWATFRTAWQKCCIFREEKKEYLESPPILYSPEYDRYTICSGSYKAWQRRSWRGSTEENKAPAPADATSNSMQLACTRCFVKLVLTTVVTLKTLRKLPTSNRDVRFTNFQSPVLALVAGVSNTLVDPIIPEVKLQTVGYC